MLLALNAQPVVSALLSVPRLGRAVLSARLASDDASIAVGAAASLEFDDGSKRAMTITRAVVERGAWSVNAVAGNDGFHKTLIGRAYQSIPSATLIRDILREIGETSGEIDAPEQRNVWIRRTGSAMQALEMILERLPGRIWRVLPNGQVTVKRERWEMHPNVLNVLEANAGEGTYTVALEQALEPGSSVQLLVDGSRIETVRVERCIHSVEPREQRTEIQVST